MNKTVTTAACLMVFLPLLGCGQNETCSVKDRGDGSSVLTCSDGTSFPLAQQDGAERARQPIVVQGDIKITHVTHLIGLQWAERIAGSLTIAADFDEAIVVLPALQTVDGSITIDRTLIRHLGLPSLHTIGGDLNIWNNTLLETLDMEPVCFSGSDASGAIVLNPRLPQCLAKRLLYLSNEVCPSIRAPYTGNNENCTCSPQTYYDERDWPVTWECSEDGGQ